MKRLLLIFTLVSLFQVVQSQNIVYVVSYDSAGVIVGKKCIKIDEAQKVFTEKVKELETGDLSDIYVVKMRQTKTGKLRRLKR